jgi:hypothetical protein
LAQTHAHTRIGMGWNWAPSALDGFILLCIEI